MPKLGLGLSLSQTKNIGRAIAIVNPNFSNLTGLTLTDPVVGWYSGVPFGWTSEKTDDNTNSVLSIGGVFYANPEQLSDSSPFQRFYQDLVGTLPSSATAVLTLKACRLTTGTNGFLEFAFYNATNNNLIANGGETIVGGTSPFFPKTVSFTTTVPAGIPFRLAFWSSGQTIGITDISVTLY